MMITMMFRKLLALSYVNNYISIATNSNCKLMTGPSSTKT